eukprot:COSAG04_NODE_173_length_21572_cov_104.574256_13_plen_109_part_00
MRTTVVLAAPCAAAPNVRWMQEARWMPTLVAIPARKRSRTPSTRRTRKMRRVSWMGSRRTRASPRRMLARTDVHGPCRCKSSKQLPCQTLLLTSICFMHAGSPDRYML